MKYTFEYEEAKYVAEVSITPGDPGSGPTYDCGGTPPSGPELEVASVSHAGKYINDEELIDAINKYLFEEKFDNILEQWELDGVSAKDEAAEARAEHRRDRELDP